MAGIGFILRKLVGEDNLSGFIRAYFHSAVISVGPWMLIVVTLGTFHALSSRTFTLRELNEFLSIFIYNLCFSFVLSGPLYMITSRYVSDCLYLKYLSPIPGILVTSLGLLTITTLPFAVPFYIYYATMSPGLTILSITNFFLLTMIWLSMLFLGLLRDFRGITMSWVLGMLLTILLSLYFGSLYQIEGILIGMNCGLSLLVASLIAHVLTEYRFPFKKAQYFNFYFRYYKELFWSGFFFFASLWADKVIMWFSPQSVQHLNHLRTYPTYDGAMFLSYLSIIPVMALFTFSLETNFYDSYINYIRCIESNAPFSSIEQERKSILAKIIEDVRSFLVLQGAISLMVILFTPQIFAFLGIDFLQLNIFRLGIVGAFFSAFNFFIVVIFSYFDSQNNMLKVTCTMFISNVVMTLMSLYLGFPYYGLGFCLSMIFSFLISAILLMRFLNQLTYHIFITNIVKRQVIREKYLARPS